MIERLYIFEDIDPQFIWGVNKSNLTVITNLYPKLRIVAHDRVLKVLGEPQETELFLAAMERIEHYVAKYNRIGEEDLIKIIRAEKPEEAIAPEVILYSTSGKPVKPLSDNQAQMVEAFAHNDLTFAIGPAGSGKTFLAIALAVRALKNKEIRRIILSRPAVEAGEKLGFLPGEMKDKLDPYLQPLYDALGEMIPSVKLKEYMENGTIQIAPLAFMRGRTLSDAIVVLDEAQNTTQLQMKMFLTRLGRGSKMIITGDASQTDLPRGTYSGLCSALGILKHIKGIAQVRLGKADIVRHPLVSKIVDAYEKTEEKEAAEKASLTRVQSGGKASYDQDKNERH